MIAPVGKAHLQDSYHIRGVQMQVSKLAVQAASRLELERGRSFGDKIKSTCHEILEAVYSSIPLRRFCATRRFLTEFKKSCVLDGMFRKKVRTVVEIFYSRTLKERR